MISGILLLALLAGVAVTLASAAHRGAHLRVDVHTLRRLFQYAVLFALVVIVTVGVTGLVTRFVGKPAFGEDADALLARSLAFALVGAPLAALLAWWSRRRQLADGSETRSGVFAAYLTVAALTGATAAAFNLQSVGGAAADGRVDGGAVAAVLAWGAVWLGHWALATRMLDGDRAVPHLLLGSLIGLILGAGGLISTLGSSLEIFVHSGSGSGRPTAPGAGLGLLVGGALIWVRYWATTAIRLPRSNLWFGIVLPVGVGGGLVLSLVGASRLIWTVLVWLVGKPAEGSATVHFGGIGRDVAVLLVGLLMWWYHRAVLGPHHERRSEVQRVYEYLMAGLGLIAAAVGAGTALVGFIEAVTPGVDVGMSVVNTVLAAVTLLIVGAPVWWVFWSRIRRAADLDRAGEVTSPTRRTYLILLFGVAGVAAVIALIAVAWTFFQDVVAGRLSGVTIRQMRYGLGTLLGTAAVSGYHWSILHHDRGAAAPRRVRGPRSVVLVGPADAAVEDAVRRATGARVESWSPLDTSTGAGAWDAEVLVELLSGHPDEDLLVLSDDGVPRVVAVSRSGRPAPPAPTHGHLGDDASVV
ncbi:DUF5671 domain-containing protein [Cumulibacter manganitolerans]|uniref:DUF5671 domain-containing protein n=1 Tax=Cumulibacter manganitolerans TaxID=1884992 RepID=UPI0012977503|nr:DUF5671 domain-containing protein [Cumulibacter manganitolerans]